MAQLAQQTGGTYTPPPEPEAPFSWRDALVALVHRTRWVTEAEGHKVLGALGELVNKVDSMEQDLAAIRARVPVLSAPVTPPQAQVLTAAGYMQAPPAPAPAQSPFPIVPGMATVVGPPPG